MGILVVWKVNALACAVNFLHGCQTAQALLMEYFELDCISLWPETENTVWELIDRSVGKI